MLGDTVVDDSRRILGAVDERGKAPSLTAVGDDGRAAMERWIERAYDLPERFSAPQHFLYFLPLPHGHGSLRPTLLALAGSADGR